MANKSSRYEVLPDNDLEPQHPVPGVPVARQAEAMRELRAMHNQICTQKRQQDISAAKHNRTNSQEYQEQRPHSGNRRRRASRG